MVLLNSCRCGAGGKTISQTSQSSRVRNPAPIFCFVLYSMGGGVLSFVFIFFLFFFATHHPPVITTTVLGGVQTLRAHSAHSHRPGGHGLLEVPLHLLPSPAKLFQRRIRGKIRQVASLQSSLALSPRSLGIPGGLPSGSSTQSVRCTPVMWVP